MDLSLADLQQATGGEIRFAPLPPRDRKNTLIEEIAIDTRRLQRGELFWALPGGARSGSDFLSDAFARGACGVVTDTPLAAPLAGQFALHVPESRLALWQLAEWNRRRCPTPIVAVTGSVGKTTAREMIHAVLGTRLDGVASPMNYNNGLGLPLSMAAVEPQHDYAVLELAANHPGEIEPLAQLCRPAVGVITRIADAHLGEFGSVEAITAAKWELTAGLQRDGILVLNGDDARLRRLSTKFDGEVLWFGRSGEAHFCAEQVHYADGRLSFRIDGQAFQLPVWGRHHLPAALAAIAVGTVFGLTFREMAESLSAFRPVPGRCAVQSAGGIQFIDDTYNASPTGMRAALELLRETNCSGRKIFVCGDMGELGSHAESLHRQLGGWIADAGPKLLFACGSFAATVSAAAMESGMCPTRITAEADPLALLAPLAETIRPGDVVLVKGCRRLAMERIVERLAAEPAMRVAG